MYMYTRDFLDMYITPDPRKERMDGLLNGLLNAP